MRRNESHAGKRCVAALAWCRRVARRLLRGRGGAQSRSVVQVRRMRERQHRRSPTSPPDQGRCARFPACPATSRRSAPAARPAVSAQEHAHARRFSARRSGHAEGPRRRAPQGARRRARHRGAAARRGAHRLRQRRAGAAARGAGQRREIPRAHRALRQAVAAARAQHRGAQEGTRQHASDALARRARRCAAASRIARVASGAEIANSRCAIVVAAQCVRARR